MFQRLLGPITKQYGGIQYNTIPESNAVSAYGDFGFLGSDVIKHIMFFLSSKDFCTASQLNNSFNKLAHDAPYTVVKLVHTRNADNRIYDLTYQQAILIHSTLSLRKEAAEKILQDGNINADVVKIVLSEIQRKSDLKNRYEHAKKELVKAECTLSRNKTTLKILKTLAGEDTVSLCTIELGITPLRRALITICLLELFLIAPTLISFFDSTLFDWINEKIFGGNEFDHDNYANYGNAFAYTGLIVGVPLTLFFSNRLPIWKNEQVSKVRECEANEFDKEGYVTSLKNALSYAERHPYSRITKRS